MDYSRSTQCNNSQGGNSKVYLFEFIDYLDSQITIENNIITDFPSTTIYNIGAFNINYSIDASENIDDEYVEKISFQLSKLKSTDNFKNIIKRDFRIILKDNNGNLRLFGLKTGLKGTFKQDSGTNRNEFNGYTFNFETKESVSAPYLNDLSLFEVSGMLQFLLQYEL